MRRRAVIVLVWLLGTVASVALAWFAVSAVGGEVTSTPDAGVAAAPGSSTTTASPPTTVTTTTSTTAAVVPATTSVTSTTTTSPVAPPPSPARQSEVFDTAGGTVGATCSGAAASLDFATPRAGYAAEVHDAGPEKVDVRFEGASTEIRVIVRCVDGRPSGAVEVDDDSSGGGSDD